MTQIPRIAIDGAIVAAFISGVVSAAYIVGKTETRFHAMKTQISTLENTRLRSVEDRLVRLENLVITDED